MDILAISEATLFGIAMLLYLSLDILEEYSRRYVDTYIPILERYYQHDRLQSIKKDYDSTFFFFCPFCVCLEHHIEINAATDKMFRIPQIELYASD